MSDAKTLLRKRAEPGDDVLQQLAKLLEPAGAQVAEHRLRHAIDVDVQALQNLAPFVGNPDFDDAAVLTAPDARHQATPAQTIDQPRDIRVARDHALGDVAAGEP